MEPVHFESLYHDNFRQEEIKRLMGFVKQGNSCSIISFPGVGRSNLLRSIAYNRSIRLRHLNDRQKWFHFVIVDFSEIKRRPLIDATKFIFLCLTDSLRERRMQELYKKVNNIFKESVGLNDEMILFQGLKKAIDFLAIEKELNIVFLFDRFEEYVPSLTENFFSNLKALRNRAKYRFSVVFSLKRPLDEVLEPTLFSEFYEFLIEHDIYLNLYDKIGTDFRISYLERVSGKKIDPGILKKIIELTGGHGKLTRLALEAIMAINSTSEESRATSKVTGTGSPDGGLRIKDFLLQQKSIIGALFEIWNFLTPSEQNFIKGDSLLESKESPYKNDTYLEKIGLIKNGKITILLFEEYIRSNEVPNRMVRDETIIFNENTNEIKKGENVLSDQLTASEYKLLKFLILNKDKVLEKEEIINAVWKETKTTFGVTDQALDQLVFRLRKKIEVDPNNPIHIQTIKGRGIRFTP